MSLTRSGFVVGVSAAIVLAGSWPAHAQGVRRLEVSFQDGKVTIVAENVTVREVLQEWGRKGGSRIVNADKLSGAPVPLLEFRDEPEAAVLRSLLRDVPGYGAAPRIAPDASSSTIAAVFILASRTVPVASGPAAAAPVAQAPPQAPQPPAPQLVPPPVIPSPDSEIPPARQIGELPPSTPGGSGSTNPNLRSGPGGTVTSTIPGVVIPGPDAGRAGGPPLGPGSTGPVPGGRGRGGGGGGGTPR